MLAHRLGLVPLNIDPRKLQSRVGASSLYHSGAHDGLLHIACSDVVAAVLLLLLMLHL